MAQLLRMEEFDRPTWLRLEQAVSDFEQAWQTGRPDLREFLAACPVESDEQRRALLLELAHADIEHCCRTGETVAAEDYFERFPELSDWPEAVRELGQAVRESGLLLPGDTSDGGTTIRFTPPGPPPELAGYEQLVERGHGGMGVVYQARQKCPARTVALKMIRAGRLASSGEVERFCRETEAAGKLQHPHIVPIYEVGEREGQAFFSMEYVEGQSLYDMVRDKPLEPRRAARYIRQTAEAIQYAHEQGVVHRDLKPANILIDAHDRARVTDFGLAHDINEDSQLTAAEMEIGTPAYMPPEQTGSKGWGKPGPSSDVYSLGATLYHLMVGRPPFQAATSQETLWHVLHEEVVAPRSLNPKLERDLETICLKCLQKDRQRRYASAQLLADDLQRFLVGKPIQARSIGRSERSVRWMKRNKLAVAAMTIIVSLLTLFLLVAEHGLVREQHNSQELIEINQRLRQTRDKYRQQKAIAEANADNLQRLLYSHSLESAAQMATDWRRGSNEATVMLNDPERCPIHLRDFMWRLLRHTDVRNYQSVDVSGMSITEIGFLSDGKSLATVGLDGRIRIWCPEMGELLQTSPDGHPLTGHLAISPDRRRIAVSQEVFRAFGVEVKGLPTIVWIWDKDDDSVTPLRTLQTEVTCLAFSPDGKYLATGSKGGAVRASVVLWDASTLKSLAKLPSGQGGVEKLTFSPEGYLATIASDQKCRIWKPITISDLNATEWPSQLVSEFSIDQKTTGALFLPASQSGSLELVTGHPNGEIRIWDCKRGVQKRSDWPNRGAITGLAVSANGTIGSAHANADFFRLYSSLLDTRCDYHTRTKAGITAIACSPDGETVASLGRDDKLRFWKTGSLPPQARFSRQEAAIVSLAMSPDGARVAALDGLGKLVLSDLRTLETLAEYEVGVATDAAYSPDGTFLAVALRDNKIQLFRAPEYQPEMTLTLHENVSSYISAIAFSNDGLYLAASVGDAIKVWETTKYSEFSNLRVTDTLLPQDRGADLVFSPRTNQLATIRHLNKIDVWNVRTNQRQRFMRDTGFRLGQAAISPDGKTLAVGMTYPAAILLLDLETGKHRKSNAFLTSGVGAVAYSPDGLTLAGAGRHSRDIYFFDPITANYRGKLPMHGGDANITALAFSSCGEILITGDIQGNKKLWYAPQAGN